MTPDASLRERLADAAAPAHRSVPDGATVRRSATRHRTQRRLATGSAVVVAVAAVAVAGGALLAPRPPSQGPATPSPSATAVPTTAPSTPAPTGPAPSAPVSTAPTTTEPAGPPPLTRAEAQAAVEDLRFAEEEAWATGDYGVGPMEVTTEVTRWESASCSESAAMVPPALAMRTVVLPDAEGSGIRQIAVFADASTAATAFAELRAEIRGCLPPAGTTAPEPGSGRTTETSLVGEQLGLGDESFWHGVVVTVVEPDGGEYESFASYAELLVLDGNVVTVFPAYPAISEEMRSDHVRQSSAAWADVVRPQYEGVLR